MEASQNKQFLHTEWSPGHIMQRGTATRPNSLIMLENAHVEPDGSIRGRAGTDNVNLDPFDDGTDNVNKNDVHSHRLYESRYIGVGSIVCRCVDAGNGLVNQGPTIISGLSGKRLTMAVMSPSGGTAERWVYFANGDQGQHGAASGDCRKKDNYITTRNWGIDGPRNIVTLTLGDDQPDFTLVDDFAAGYTAKDGIGTDGAATEPYDTSSRLFTVPANKTERFQRDVVVDMSPYGDTGFVRLMIRVDRVANLEHIEIAFNVDEGTVNTVTPPFTGLAFRKDFFQYKIPASVFEKDNVWQEIKIRKNEFARTKPTDGSQRTWANANAVQITVAALDNTDPLKVSVDDLRIEDDTHPDGVYDYRLTWWNDDLKIRSNSLALVDIYSETDRTSAKIYAQRQRIIIDRSAVTTSDAQVTHWELWRRNHNGNGIFGFVDRISIASTTYNDDFADYQIGDELINDNHIPPSGRYVVDFDDRLFIMGMKSGNFFGPTSFTGSGINDAHISGDFTGTSNTNIVIAIDGTGTPDTFKYSIDGGVTFIATGVPITGEAQELVSGITVTFATTTGHTMTASWQSTAIKTGEEEAAFSVRYSSRFRPESFPLTNYFLAGEPADIIRGCAVWHGQLFIWTQRYVYRVTPIDQSYVAQKTEAPVGTESPYAISASPVGVFYYAPEDGPYLFDGATAVSISSQQLDPFFGREKFEQDGISIPPAAANLTIEFENIVAAYYNRYFYLTVDDEAGDCITLIYNTELKRWHRAKGKGWNVRRWMWEKSGNEIATADNLEAGNSDGYLVLIEPLPERFVDYDNSPVKVIIQQSFDVVLKPGDVEIDVKDILLDANLGGQGALVEVSFDDYPLEVIGVAHGLSRQHISLPIPDVYGRAELGRICYKLSVRLTISQESFRPEIFGIGLRYWPEPRRSMSYSAMWFAPKEQGWMRRAWLILRSYGKVTAAIYTDSLHAYEVDIPSTEGNRLGMNFSVPTGVRGKVSVVIFTSSEPFVFYPQSYIEMYPLGITPQQVIPWQLTP